MKLFGALLVASILPWNVISAQSRDSARVTPPQAPAHDALFGLDKPKHFVLSAFIEGASFAAFQGAGASRRSAAIGAVSATAVFAIGREYHDRRTKGLFSFGDLFWDALGGGAAYILVRHTYR